MSPASSAWSATRQRFDALSLPSQIGLGGIFVAVLSAGAARWEGTPWGVAAALVAAALTATAAGALLARRASRALVDVAAAARALTPDDAPPERHIPLRQACRELRAATIELRQMVEAARRRQRELQARNESLGHQLVSRTHQLTTLQDLSIGLATRSDLHELVGEALHALQQTLEFSSASLWARRDPPADETIVLLGYRLQEGADVGAEGDLTGMRLSRANAERYEQIERERRTLVENRARQSLLSWLWQWVTDDARSSALYRATRSWIAVPLAFRDRVLGVLRVDHYEPDYFDAERSRLLQAVGSQAALAMRHARLAEHERQLAVLAERNRIARDLHDAVSQTLFAANVTAGTLARAAGRGAPLVAEAVGAQAQTLERLTRGALAEMRLLMFELRPDALERTPLHELLQQAVDALSCRGGLEVEAEIERGDDLAAEVRTQLYRIAQEALSNVVRHSGATHLRVEWLVHGPGRATLRVADDGHGFDPTQPRPGHFGLENMRSRAEEAGARYTLRSAPGEGTELRVEIGALSHEG